MTEPRGAALREELERRFVTTREPVALPGLSLELLKPRSAEELISEEDFAVDERLPYWAEIWPSSLVLASRLLEERGSGRRLLELGCGVGVVSTAALAAGFDVLATDYYDDALRFTRLNAWLATGREPEARHVDWRAFPPDLGRFDVVVAADVLYERPYARLVAEAVERTLAPHGVALVADPGRIAAEEFVRTCGALGLRYEGAEERPYEAAGIRQTIRMHQVRWM
ncbi:MAG TPA: methyltransferase domain-containing protein [Gemmatimonadaceae bacterium]|nr:methyltransferase domain-containing protein [Gemmatimonadaceae bacterium]